MFITSVKLLLNLALLSFIIVLLVQIMENIIKSNKKWLSTVSSVLISFLFIISGIETSPKWRPKSQIS